MRIRPIAISLNPNVSTSDISFALQSLCNPISYRRWKHGKSTKELNTFFEQRFSGYTAQSFDSGRSALQAVLRSLGIGNNEKVVLQSFTCIVVPNAIRAVGAVPLFCDMDTSYNIDATKLEALLQNDPHIRAVIVQHTFGQPADIHKIQQLCRTYNALLIEDCAHALGAQIDGNEVGTFGDASIFSFGRDKVISSVSGGVALVKNMHNTAELKRIHESSPLPSWLWIKQRLLHPIIFSLATATYNFFSLGKMCIELTKRLHLWPLVLTVSEKRGAAERPMQMPNILAEWALHQLAQLDQKNEHRKKIATIYRYELGKLDDVRLPKKRPGTQPMYLRYTIETPHAAAIKDKAQAHGILLGDWYHNGVDPQGSNLTSCGFVLSEYPKTERATSHILNLPTHENITVADAQTITTFLKEEL